MAESPIRFIRFNLVDRAATLRFGLCLGRHLPAGTVLLLEGNLGSGKTTLVQGLGQGLGIADPVDSPTFTLVNEYLEGRLPLYHLDLYRLVAREVEALHPELYWDPLENQPGIVAIEWAERLPLRPKDYLQIELRHQTDDGREGSLLVRGEAVLPDSIWEALRQD